MNINLDSMNLSELKDLKKSVNSSIDSKINESIETVNFKEYIDNLKTTINNNKTKIEKNNNLYNFLENTKISNLRFLSNQISSPYGNINLCSGINNFGAISGYKIDCNYDSILDLARFFNKINNVTNYQGTYTLYQFLFDYLSNTIKEKTKNPTKKVFKDYKDKKILVMEDFKNLAQTLYDYREEKPGSKIAVCENILWKHKNKVDGTPFTIPQMDLIDTIAFCTPIKELEKKDYSRCKKLVFYPIKEK